MRRWFGLALLFCATAALAQDSYSDNKNAFSVEKNGGTAVSVSGGSMATDALWNAAGDIVYATGDNAGAVLAKGTATQLLHSGAAPSWSAVNLAADVTGVLPFANFTNGSALSLFGRSANSAGVQASITCTAAGFGVFRESGSTIGCGAIDVSTAAVTGLLPYANIASGSANSVWGRASNSSGVHADIAATLRGQYTGFDGTTVAFTDPFAQQDLMLIDEEFCFNHRFATNVTGSGATVAGNSINGGSGHPCTRAISAGTATGSAAWEAMNTNVTTPTPIENSGAAWTIIGSVRLSSVGDGTDVIKYYLGGCSTGGAGADCNTGMYLRYDRSVSTTNWYLCAANNGSRTCTDTTIAVVVNTNWTNFIITSNAANNQLSCVINAVACATGPTSNLPAAGNGWAGMLKLDKTAGSTTTFTLEGDLYRIVAHGLSRS